MNESSFFHSSVFYNFKKRFGFCFLLFSAFLKTPLNASFHDDPTSNYVSQIQQIEHATNRIAWTLENFKVHAGADDFFKLFNEQSGEPGKKATEIKQFLGVDPNELSPKGLVQQFTALQSSCDKIAELFEDETKILLEDPSFTHPLESISNQLLDIANALQNEFTLYIHGESSAPLEHILSGDSSIERLKTLFETIKQNVTKSAQIFPILLNAIVDIKNTDLIDATASLSGTFQNLSNSVEKISETLEEKKNLFSNYDEQLDSYTLDVVKSVEGSLTSLAFDATHETRKAEFIDLISSFENIISAFLEQLIEVGSNVSFPPLEPKDDAVYVYRIKQVSSDIRDIIKDTTQLIDIIQTSQPCIMAPSFDEPPRDSFIEPLHDIEKQMTESFNQINAICRSVFKSPPFPLITINKTNKRSTVQDLPSLFKQINDDIFAIHEPFQTILKAFQKNFNEEIGIAINALSDDIVLLSQKIGSHDPNSLLQTLATNSVLCCHPTEISIDKESIKKIQEGLDMLPFVNLQSCCNPIFDSFQNIQSCCFQIFRYIDVMQKQDKSYSWEAHVSWERIFGSINLFLEQLKTQTPITVGEFTETDYCKMDVLVDYLEKASKNADTMCGEVRKVLEDQKLTDFVFNEPITQRNRGCDSIAFFLKEIQIALDNTFSLFPNIEKRFLKSDYAFDEALKKTIGKTGTLLKEVIDQVGVKIPKITDICSQCHFLTHGGKASNIVPPLNCPEGNEHEDICTTICDKVLEISDQCVSFETLLGTSLCCHQPYIEMVGIRDVLTATHLTWASIAALPEFPYLSIVNITDLAAELEKNSSDFTEATQQIKEIQDLATSPLLSTQNPCFWYNALPFLKALGLKNHNFYTSSGKISALFKASTSEVIPTFPLVDADFCTNNQESFKNITNLLGEIQKSLSKINEKLNLRNVIRYSESLEFSFLKSLTAFDLLRDQINQLKDSSGSKLMTCTPNLDTTKTNIEATATTAHEICKTVQSYCCSYFSKDLYHSEFLFRNLTDLFGTLYGDYSSNADLTELLPLFEPLSAELSNTHKILNSLGKDIEQIKENTNTPHCKIYFLTNHWHDLNENLEKVSENFINILSKKNGRVATKATEEQAPDHFNCSNRSTFISKIVEECSSFSKKLQEFGVLLRWNPPFDANEKSILSTVTEAKQVFISFCEILKFFEKPSSLATSLCADNCKGCVPSQPIQDKVLSDLIIDFGKNFDELSDLLSKPGCCVTLSDEMMTLSNHLLKIQQMSAAFGKLDKIILKIPEDDFVTKLDQFCTPLTFLQTLLADLCKLKLENLGENVCSKRLLTPSIQSINQAFESLQDPLKTIFETFGPILYTVDAMTPNRLISGCEFLSSSVEKMSETMNAVVTTFRTVLGTLIKEKTRPYYPNAIAELEKIGKQWSLIQTSFVQFFTLFEESTSCAYCQENKFTTLIKQNFQRYNTSTKLFSGLFNEDLNPLKKTPDATIIGCLKSYCCSESNIILREIATEFLCIQQLVSHMGKNPKLFESSFDSAIIHKLDPIQHRFSNLLEAVSTYGNALKTAPKTFCKVAPNIEYLRKVQDAVTNFKHVLLNFANLTQSDCSLQYIVPFNSKPYETQNAIDSINSSGQLIGTALNALTLAMQSNVAYAYNPDLCNFISWIRQQKLDEAFGQIAVARPCSYCSMNFDVGFSGITTPLMTLQKRLENPTCCHDIQKTLNKISAHSQNIIRISDNLLSLDSLSTSFSEPMLQNFYQRIKMLSHCGESFIARLDSISKNSPCLLRELEAPISEVEKFSDELASDFKNILWTFGGTKWIDSDTNPDIQGGTCQGETGLEDFSQALTKANLVSQHISSAIHKKPIIDYRKELPIYLKNILDELSTTVNIFETLSTNFSTFTECYACRNHDNSYAKQMQLIGKEANDFHSSFSTILTNIQDKCCSPCFDSLTQLTHQINRLNAYADKIVHDNPVFVTHFFTINGPYDILSKLNGNTDFQGIFPKLIDLLEETLTSLVTLGASNQTACANLDLIPYIQKFTNLFEEGANIFQLVYQNKYENGDVIEPVIPQLLDYSCHSSVLSNLISSFKETTHHVDDLVALQDENVYSIDGDVLAPTIASTVKHLDTISNIFSQIMLENQKTPIITCTTCPSFTSFFSPFEEGSQKLRDAFKKIKIEIKDVNCCQQYIHLTGLCAQQISEIQDQTRYFLQENEKELLHVKTIVERKDNRVVDKILNLVPDLTLSLNTILEPLQEMNNTLQNAKTENPKHCFSMACFPYLLEIHKTLQKLNINIKEKMKYEYHYYAPLETPSIGTPSTECNHRIENIQTIIKGVNDHLSAWNRFSHLFGRLDLMCEAPEFPEMVSSFSNALVQIRQALGKWGENNKIISIIKKIDEKETSKDVSLFCLRCPTTQPIDTLIQQASSEETIRDTFLPLTNHLPVHPSYFIKQPLDLLSQNIQKLEGILSRLSSSSHFTVLLSQTPANPLWQTIVQKVQSLVPTFIAWKDISADSPEETMYEKDQKLVDRFSKINASLFDLCNLFEKLYSETGLQASALYHKPSFSPILYQEPIELFEKIGHQFDSFSVTWGQFCNAVDHYTIDAYRESMAQVFNDLHETFKTLYLHIPSEKLMQNPLYSRKINDPQHGKAQNIMKKVVQSTNLLLNSLWAYNCCNTQASCLYALHQLISQVTSMIQPLQDPVDLENTFLIFNRTFLSCAQNLQSMYAAMTPVLIKKENTVHCQWAAVAPCFSQLEQTLVETTQDLSDLNHVSLPAIESWDTRSTSSRNDCGFLPDLHNQISDTLKKWTIAFLNLCSNEQKKDAKSFKLMTLQTSLSQLSSALNQFLTLSKSNATLQQVMCQSCNNPSLLNSLGRIYTILQQTSNSLENMSQAPQVMLLESIKNQNIQLCRMILQESTTDSSGPILSFQSTARETINTMVDTIKKTKVQASQVERT